MLLKMPLYHVIERLVNRGPGDYEISEDYEAIELEARGLIPYY
ncbi:MAG TPA: hypothetical protein VJ461_00805 [Candidatus Nanoarchaeia archaeon]|nr:hypothetical protein [Candidatus Nanoarchaeia archaeon]